jgi:hypothetical protein
MQLECSTRAQLSKLNSKKLRRGMKATPLRQVRLLSPHQEALNGGTTIKKIEKPTKDTLPLHHRSISNYCVSLRVTEYKLGRFDV